MKYCLTLFCLGVLFKASVVYSANVRLVTEPFQPFQFIDQKGDLKGLSVEIIRELSFELSDQLIEKIEVYPWARAYKLATEEPNVLIFTISKTESRLRNFSWLYSYNIDNSAYFWIRKDNAALHDIDWTKAKKLRTSIPRDDTNLDLLLERGFSQKDNLFVTNDFHQAIKMLVLGRSDFVFAGNVSMTIQLKSTKFNRNLFKKVPTEGAYAPKLSFAFSKGTDSEMVKKYREAFLSLEERGIIQKNIEKYLRTYDFNGH